MFEGVGAQVVAEPLELGERSPQDRLFGLEPTQFAQGVMCTTLFLVPVAGTEIEFRDTAVGTEPEAGQAGIGREQFRDPHILQEGMPAQTVGVGNRVQDGGRIVLAEGAFERVASVCQFETEARLLLFELDPVFHEGADTRDQDPTGFGIRDWDGARFERGLDRFEKFRNRNGLEHGKRIPDTLGAGILVSVMAERFSWQWVSIIPSTGRPVHGSVAVEPIGLKMSWDRVLGGREFDVLVQQGDQRYRDRLVLDSFEARYRFAQRIERFFRLARGSLAPVVEALYDEFVSRAADALHCYPLHEAPAAAPVAFLLGDWLPENHISILAADGGVGKSLLAILVCLMHASNGPTPFGESVSNGTWIYLDWEGQGVRLFRHRLERFARALHAATGRESYLKAGLNGEYWQLDQPLMDLLRELTRQLQETPPSLVVLDSLSVALDGSLNDEQHARDCMRVLMDWCRMGHTLLAIAHVAKEDVRQRYRVGPYGSRMFYNLARQVWQLERVGLKSEAPYRGVWQLSMLKNNFGGSVVPVYYTLEWSDPPMVRILSESEVSRWQVAETTGSGRM